jgi:hypothetical protein
MLYLYHDGILYITYMLYIYGRVAFHIPPRRQFFLESLLVWHFRNFRQSTTFYSAYRTKNYDRKWVWSSVSAVPWCYFSRFLLRLPSIFVWWHGHNLTTRNRGNSNVGLIDSAWSSYSTKVPLYLFLTCSIMLKKKHGAKEYERRPCRATCNIHIHACGLYYNLQCYSEIIEMCVCVHIHVCVRAHAHIVHIGMPCSWAMCMIQRQGPGSQLYATWSMQHACTLYQLSLSLSLYTIYLCQIHLRYEWP